MNKSAYLPIRWVEDYQIAPENAKYIVRILSDSVILEEYDGLKSSITLAEFPKNAIDEFNYTETLAKCRDIIGNNHIIWVEMPFWKWIENHSEDQ